VNTIRKTLITDDHNPSEMCIIRW